MILNFSDIISTVCPLCKEMGTDFYKSEFYLCNQCFGIFRPNNKLPNMEQEKQRYLLHNNSVEDENYVKFLSPIIEAVKLEQPKSAYGLDYGSGPTPVLTKLLQSEGYNILPYDPFFESDSDILVKKYDYIVCSEVVEHFHKPMEEFVILKNLLNNGGKLYIMTLLFNANIDFETWHYKNDFTHTFIYQEETFRWIKEKYGFDTLKITNRLIELA